MLISLRNVLVQLQNKQQTPKDWSPAEITDTQYFLGVDFVACLTLCLNESKNQSNENPHVLAKTPMGQIVSELYNDIKSQFYVNILKKPNPTPIPKPFNNNQPFQMPPWPSENKIFSVTQEQLEKQPLEDEETNGARKKIRLRKTPNTSPVMLSQSLSYQKFPSNTTSPILNARSLSACAHESDDSPVQKQATAPSPVLKAN